MSYYTYEGRKYEDYLVDYYGADHRTGYQDLPVYDYYYPSGSSEYGRYDLCRGDYYANKYIEGVRYQYDQPIVQYPTVSPQFEDEDSSSVEDQTRATASTSTPLIPKYLYTSSPSKTLLRPKRRKRLKGKRFPRKNKLEKLEEVEEGRKKSLVAKETGDAVLSEPLPVKQCKPLESLQAKFEVEEEKKSTEMSNLAGIVTSKYHSLANVMSSSEKPPSDDMIEMMKRRSMPDTSIDSNESLDSNDLKPSCMSTDCTCVTIDSEEYREFVKQINKIPQANITQQSSSLSENIVRSDSAPPIQIGALLRTVYDANNNGILENRDLTLTGKIDFKSDPVQRSRRERRCKTVHYKKRQTYVNPLAEVPLHSPLRHLFGSLGQQKHCRRTDESPHRMKRSCLVKLFRCVITMIGCLQSFAYRYALRYILFI